MHRCLTRRNVGKLLRNGASLYGRGFDVHLRPGHRRVCPGPPKQTSCQVVEGPLRGCSLRRSNLRKVPSNPKIVGMKHWLAAAVSVVSALLCLLVLVLWARSYFVYDLVSHDSHADSHAEIGTRVMSISGRIAFYHFNEHTNDEPPNTEFVRVGADSPEGRKLLPAVDLSGTPHWWNHLGFWWNHHSFSDPGLGITVVIVPHWFVASIFLIPVLPLLLRVRHRSRIRTRLRAGACTACGYSLTGNTSGVCPECGATIKSQPPVDVPKPS